jgi:hypothetical protein
MLELNEQIREQLLEEANEQGIYGQEAQDWVEEQFELRAS